VTRQAEPSLMHAKSRLDAFTRRSVSTRKLPVQSRLGSIKIYRQRSEQRVTRPPDPQSLVLLLDSAELGLYPFIDGLSCCGRVCQQLVDLFKVFFNEGGVLNGPNVYQHV
jgi:hypothetical protein